MKRLIHINLLLVTAEAMNGRDDRDMRTTSIAAQVVLRALQRASCEKGRGRLAPRRRKILPRVLSRG